MVYCDDCLRNVKGTQMEDGELCCEGCALVLEDYCFCFYEESHYVRNVAVDDYLHNEEGMSYKKIKLWEDYNHEYIKELASKEDVAKKAFEAFVENCSKNLLAARDKLAQSAVESITKSRKECVANELNQ